MSHGRFVRCSIVKHTELSLQLLSLELEITDIEKANHYLVSKSKAVDEANLVNKAQLEILEGEKERHLALIHELETVPLDLEGKYSA
ncbi:hypothetical protein V6N13_138451 [Hibiscus sabdariffa]